jgi:Spy/CpxP family protein refolding chaperone
MARPLSWAFAALLACSGPAVQAAELCDGLQQRAGQPPAKPDPGRSGEKTEKPGDRDGHPRLKWWIDPALRGQLAITDQQSALVDQIWQKNAPALREIWAKLQKLEEALTQMTKDNSVDEAAVIAQIDKVETMRAEGNKRRTLMIYRMNKILTPDQRAKVRALFEHDPQRRGPSSR